MNLSEFMGMWKHPNIPVLICDDLDYIEISDYLEEVSKGYTKLCLAEMEEYTMFSFNPYRTAYGINVFLKPKFVNAQVKRFNVTADAMIIFIEVEGGLT